MEKITYVKYRNDGFKGLFPGKMALVEASMLAGMLIKYEEDFIICSKIDEAMSMVQKKIYLLFKIILTCKNFLHQICFQ